MQLVVEVKDKQFNAELEKLLATLEDGKYIIDIRPLKAIKTERDFQKEYFALVDTIRDITGNSRSEIHNEFKEERDIETTKGFSIQNWVDFIESFKWYYFIKADILL